CSLKRGAPVSSAPLGITPGCSRFVGPPQYNSGCSGGGAQTWDHRAQTEHKRHKQSTNGTNRAQTIGFVGVLNFSSGGAPVSSAPLGITPGGSRFVKLSSYFQFRIKTELFTQEISRINKQLANRLIFGVDANAFSPRWGDPRRNEKGRLVEQLILDLGLTIENTPDNRWSFHGSRGESNVDITLTR
ncbi:Uncharacterized protein FWK35_00029320, partial [Aphis craccivora]